MVDNSSAENVNGVSSLFFLKLMTNVLHFNSYSSNCSRDVESYLRWGTQNQTDACLLPLPSMGYRILWLPWGGPQRPPSKKTIKESFLTPCCYIAFLLDIFMGYMQKISQKSQNLSKISGF